MPPDEPPAPTLRALWDRIEVLDVMTLGGAVAWISATPDPPVAAHVYRQCVEWMLAVRLADLAPGPQAQAAEQRLHEALEVRLAKIENGVAEIGRRDR